MKRVGFVIIVVVMMMVLPAGLFAGGNIEERHVTAIPNTIQSIDNSIPKMEITYDLTGGRTGVQLAVSNWNVDYGLYRTTENGNTVYRKISNGDVIQNQTASAAIFANVASPDPVELTEESQELFINLTTVNAEKGAYTGLSYLEPFESDYGNLLESTSGRASFFYHEYGTDKEIDMLVINDSKDEYLRLSFTVRTEFFQNEYTLFNPHTTYSYKEKAMAFMGKVIGSLFQSNFDTLNTGLSSADIPWTLFDGTDDGTIRKGKQDFKRKLSMHFDLIPDKEWEEGYPVLDTTGIFDSIYGTDKNIYLSAYLQFLLIENGDKNIKPLLSEVYVDLYGAEGSTGLNNYNYRNYKALDYAEGEKLARNALRYYTWGVEYTPFEGYSPVVTGRNLVPVWQTYNLIGYLSEWLNGGEDGPRANNYLSVIPAAYDEDSEPPVTAVFETNAVERITIKPEENETSLNLSRIDIWSAENLAWSSDAYQPTVWRVPRTENTISPVTLSLANRSALNDKKLVLEDSSTNGNKNLKIDRVADCSDQGIGVGYTSTNADMSVKSLLLVKGYSPLTDENYGDLTDYPFMYDWQEYISIYYANENEQGQNEWIKLQPSEYIEVVTDNIKNNYTFYPETKSRKPGYGIWQNYFSNNNTELVYSYLILSSSINCKSIMIVDNSGNEFLNVTEMALFSDDPLLNLNYEQVEAVNDEKEIYWSSGEVTASGSVNSIEEIMINGAPGTTFNVGGSDMNYIQINTKAVAPIRQISGWEPGSNSSEIVLKNNFVYTFGDLGIESSDFFIPLKDLSDADTWGSVVSITDTPFYWGSNLKSLGNPLPYVPGGLDGPRTFAYKMGEQLKARISAGFMIWGKNALSTKAINDIYNTGYIDATSFSGSLGINKPFKPGFYINNSTGGFDSTLSPENVAGVDDMGILQGAMAMFPDDTFQNVKNEDITFGLDKYFGMNEAGSYGLDGDKTPLFEPEGDNSYESILKLTPSDIERNSVIIPDISQMQEGDILVRNTRDESNVGIVVGFLDDKPAVPTPASNWWDNVLVISSRAGFQMATLGTWGNPDGLFGGFSEKPEEYVIRRLMKKTGTITGLKTEDWESVKTVYPAWYTHYGEYKKIAEEYFPIGYLTSENELYQKMKTEQYSKRPYFKRLPPTSLPDKKLTNSLFYNGTTDPRMRVSSLTGWRRFNEKLSYHRAIDIIDGDAEPGLVKQAYSSSDYGNIYAPEDGLYWIIDKTTLSNLKEYIQISDTEMLVVDSYGKAYGDIGVLVTPQRIYLFAHMSLEDHLIEDTTFNIGISDNFYSRKSTDEYYGDEVITAFPTSYGQAINIKKGAWIGIMGDNSYGVYPSMLPHMHFEVYERFLDYRPVGFDYISDNEGRIDKIVNTNFFNNESEGRNLITLEFIKRNLQWQRIDPLTIFSSDNTNPDNSPYYLSTDADETQDIIDKMENISVMGTEIGIISTNELGVMFSDWPAPVTWEGGRP
ncbi:MAG: hypothetical protein L3J12_00035 [Spirochaetales bacterium]|nr:hypothetical protein [Spirochaetales bacterium]